MNCQNCAKLDLTGYANYAMQDLGKCPHDGGSVSKSITWDRQCSNFSQAKPDVVAARINAAQEASAKYAAAEQTTRAAAKRFMPNLYAALGKPKSNESRK